MWGSSLFLFIVVHIPILNAQTFNPKEPCYLLLSGTQELCYFDPNTGYDCEYCIDFAGGDCSNVDPTGDRRSLPMCGDHGQCYTPLALLLEVCYFTHSYGYNCYYEPDLTNLANLTLCNNLKANSAPRIQFVAGNNPSRTTAEDTPALIDIISVSDLDADDSIQDGEGHITVNLEITQGVIAFVHWAAATPTDRVAAEEVLVTHLNDKDNGIEFMDLGYGTNGSYAPHITITGIQDNIRAGLQGLVFKPAPHFNTNRPPYQLVLSVTVDDNGNTGGVSEIVTDTVALTASPVNDPPTVLAPPTLTTTEDVPRLLLGISVDDVDQADGGIEEFTLSLVVSHGELSIRTLHGATDNSPLNQPTEINVNGRMDEINLVIGDITYTPDTHFFGDDILTIEVDDGGHTGSGAITTTTATVTLSTTAENDAPTISLASEPLLQTTEGSPINIGGVSIDDVDSGMLTVTVIGVTSGAVSRTSVEVGIADRGDALNSPTTNPAGPVQYIPDPDFSGTVTLTLQVIDDAPLASNEVEALIVVKSVNDPPTLCINVGSVRNGAAQINPDLSDQDACRDADFNGFFAVRLPPEPASWAAKGNPQSRRFQQGRSTTGFSGSTWSGATVVARRDAYVAALNTLPRLQIDDVDSGSGQLTVLIVATKGATVTWDSISGPAAFSATPVFADDDQVLLLFQATLANLNDAIQNGIVYTAPTPFVVGTTAELIFCASDNAASGETSPDGFSVCFEIDITAAP